MKDILEKCCLQKNFSSRKCLHLKKNHSIKVILIYYLNQRIFNEIILRWRVYFFFFLRVQQKGAVTQRCSGKKVFLNLTSKCMKNTYEEVYFWSSCWLKACNFTKNELLQRYFPRILIANIIWQNQEQLFSGTPNSEEHLQWLLVSKGKLL